MEALGRQDWIEFLAVESVMCYALAHGEPREVARRRLENTAISSPAAMIWFDLRWPEDGP